MNKFKNLIKCIIKYSDKYLLVEKWFDDRIVDPYQWEFVDGTLEYMETPEETVKRLMKDSLGILPVSMKPLYTWGLTIGEICNVGIAFICEIDTDEITLSDDYCEYQFVSPEEIKDYITNRSILMDLSKSGIIKYDADIDFESWR